MNEFAKKPHQRIPLLTFAELSTIFTAPPLKTQLIHFGKNHTTDIQMKTWTNVTAFKPFIKTVAYHLYKGKVS